MLGRHLNHNFMNVWPHFQPLFVSPSALSPFTCKGLKRFVSNPIFLFRTRSVNKILCHLWPQWFYPASFFPLSLPSRLFLPGGRLSRSLNFSAGIFSTPGKNGKYFFPLLSSLSSCSWALSVVYPASRFWRVYCGVSYLNLIFSCVQKTVAFAQVSPALADKNSILYLSSWIQAQYFSKLPCL